MCCVSYGLMFARSRDICLNALIFKIDEVMWFSSAHKATHLFLATFHRRFSQITTTGIRLARSRSTFDFVSIIVLSCSTASRSEDWIVGDGQRDAASTLVKRSLPVRGLTKFFPSSHNTLALQVCHSP